jgi:hypothetical protein
VPICPLGDRGACDVVIALDQAIRARDFAQFRFLMHLKRYTCSQAESDGTYGEGAFFACFGQPPGTELIGVPLGGWHAGGGIRTQDEIALEWFPQLVGVRGVMSQERAARSLTRSAHIVLVEIVLPPDDPTTSSLMATAGLVIERTSEEWLVSSIIWGIPVAIASGPCEPDLLCVAPEDVIPFDW